jgi:gliding motility-associated protein GldM
MAQPKLTPRQRMINMMYLVLTALLALNISREIINAFVTVNESLEISNKNITAKNQRTYDDFKFAMENDPVKTKPFYDRALTVKKHSDELVEFIENIKKELISATDRLKKGEAIPSLGEMRKKEDYDVPTTIMCGSESDGRGKRASELKAKMDEYKNNVIKTLDPEDQPRFRQRFDELLSTADPDPNSRVVKEDKKRTWEMANFYYNPVVATVALLTKFQTDVRNAESETINHLFNAINRTAFKFDALEARVIAPSSYVLLGQKYTADVFLAAYSSTANPKIVVGDVDTAKKIIRGQGIQIPVSGGLGKYEVTATSEGLKKWGGIITVKNPATNEEEHYPFMAEYIAARPSTVISADKMNVLYIGVDNPMSISVPGVANENVTATISGGGGTLVKDPQAGPGKYIARVTTQGEAIISVTAKMDGKNVPMGQMKYRVKRVPDPVAMVANMKGGKINKNVLVAQAGVIPVMENFDFDLFFKVKSFKVTIVRKGKDPVELTSESNLITPQMKEIISASPIGTKVYFEYIRAVGPDGTTRSLAPLNFELN